MQRKVLITIDLWAAINWLGVLFNLNSAIDLCLLLSNMGEIAIDLDRQSLHEKGHLGINGSELLSLLPEISSQFDPLRQVFLIHVLKPFDIFRRAHGALLGSETRTTILPNRFSKIELILGSFDVSRASPARL